MGNYEQASAHCRHALDLNRELGLRHNEAATWDSLGYVEHHLGRLAEAVACYQEALRLFRELGDRHHQADTLIHLGDSCHARGGLQDSRDAFQQALRILDELHHPDADQVRAKLRDLSTAGPAGSADLRRA